MRNSNTLVNSMRTGLGDESKHFRGKTYTKYIVPEMDVSNCVGITVLDVEYRVPFCRTMVLRDRLFVFLILASAPRVRGLVQVMRMTRASARMRDILATRTTSRQLSS